MNRQHTPARTATAITEFTLDDEEMVDAVRDYINKMAEFGGPTVPEGSASVCVTKDKYGIISVRLKVIHESPDA